MNRWSRQEVAISKSKNRLEGHKGRVFDVSFSPDGETIASANSDRTLGRLRSELEYTTLEEVVKDGLHGFLDDFQIRLNGVSEQISENFFSLKTA